MVEMQGVTIFNHFEPQFQGQQWCDNVMQRSRPAKQPGGLYRPRVLFSINIHHNPGKCSKIPSVNHDYYSYPLFVLYL